MSDYNTVLQQYVNSKIDKDIQSFTNTADLHQYIQSFQEFTKFALNENYCSDNKKQQEEATTYEDKLIIQNKVNNKLWKTLQTVLYWIREMRPTNTKLTTSQDKKIPEQPLFIDIPTLSYSTPDKPKLIPIFTSVDEKEEIISCIGLYCPRKQEFYRLNTYLCSSEQPKLEEIPNNFDIIYYSLTSTHGAGSKPLHTFIIIQTLIKNIMRAEHVEFY